MDDIEVQPAIRNEDESWCFILEPLSDAGRAWIEDDLPAWMDAHLPDGRFDYYDQDDRLIIDFAYLSNVLASVAADGLTCSVGEPRQVSTEQ